MKDTADNISPYLSIKILNPPNLLKPNSISYIISHTITLLAGELSEILDTLSKKSNLYHIIMVESLSTRSVTKTCNAVHSTLLQLTKTNHSTWTQSKYPTAVQYWPNSSNKHHKNTIQLSQRMNGTAAKCHRPNIELTLSKRWHYSNSVQRVPTQHPTYRRDRKTVTISHR